MIKRLLAASAAFLFGIVLLPVIPLILAVIIFNEYDGWEES